MQAKWGHVPDCLICIVFYKSSENVLLLAVCPFSARKIIIEPILAITLMSCKLIDNEIEIKNTSYQIHFSKYFQNGQACFNNKIHAPSIMFIRIVLIRRKSKKSLSHIFGLKLGYGPKYGRSVTKDYWKNS